MDYIHAKDRVRHLCNPLALIPCESLDAEALDSRITKESKKIRVKAQHREYTRERQRMSRT